MFLAIKADLPKAGLCGSIASPIQDGPGLSGDIRVSSLFDIQGSTRTTFLEHVFKATSTGKMITNNIESIVLDIGFYGSLWEMPFSRCKLWISNHSWIYAVCDYNYKNSIRLQLQHTELEPQRVHDKSLIEIASQIYDDTTSLK